MTRGSTTMNSWTDIGLIVAIVIGLISAASLPMVSVKAVSPESLRMQQASRDEPTAWALVSEGRLEGWEHSGRRGFDAGSIKPLDARQARTAAR